MPYSQSAHKTRIIHLTSVYCDPYLGVPVVNYTAQKPNPCTISLDMRRKVGAAVPLSEEEMGPHLTQCGMGRGLYLHIMWHLDPSNRLATIHQRYKTDRLLGQTYRQADKGPIAQGEPFYKRSPQRPHIQTLGLLNFLYVLLGTVARSSSDENGMRFVYFWFCG